jgi:Holliday junction resolvase RusA-like endonuclease
MDNLHIIFNELPPTSNKIYFGGTRLTATATKYAEDFAKYVAQNHLHEVSTMDSGAVYAVHLRFYFDKLTNDSWNNPKLPPSKRAKSRYKRIDLDNRIKLLTDCIRDAIGVDDCQFFAGSQEKHEAPGKERVEIIVEKIDPLLFGVGDDTFL